MKLLTNILVFLVIITGLSCYHTSPEAKMTAALGVPIPTEEEAWNPDAGVIKPLTDKATIIASSNSSNVNAVLDGNTNTHWQSAAPFPNAFLKRADQNILLNYLTQQTCQYSTIDKLVYVADGNEQTKSTIRRKNGSAWIDIDLEEPTDLYSLSIRVQNVKSAINILITNSNGKEVKVGTLLSFDANKLRRFTTKEKNIKHIILRSDSEFDLVEIAALAQAPKEFVIVDLNEIKPVGWITGKYWAGDQTAVETNLYLSTDKINWVKIAALNPESTNEITTLVSPAIEARYIKLEHSLFVKDWNKVFAWEIKAYDQYGPYGPMPAPTKNPHSFAELIGVNGIWGWGHEKYSDLTNTGGSPEFYTQVASHARNYHFLDWDITEPDNVPDFSKMKDKGTPALWWLNWDREYQLWKNAGLDVFATIKFNQFDEKRWKNPYQSAYQYGHAFAKYFGPTHGNNLVHMMEVGNEPWYYNSSTYQQILLGMAKGAKDADPKMRVLPCALHATDPDVEVSGHFKNYMGARISEDAANYLDGINVHHYSYIQNKDGKRMATFPEHPYTSFRALLNDIKFRNQNMPGKGIYVTEWGWDSDGGGQSCTHGECVSEAAQASYAIRGLMMMARLGIDRAAWFFYANENKTSSLYTRSGLTSSPDSGFKIKKSFKALQAMNRLIGDKHFISVIQENEQAWVYLLGDKEAKPSHLIAWRPIDAESEETLSLKIPFAYQPTEAWTMKGIDAKGEAIEIPITKNGQIHLNLTAHPILVAIQ